MDVSLNEPCPKCGRTIDGRVTQGATVVLVHIQGTEHLECVVEGEMPPDDLELGVWAARFEDFEPTQLHAIVRRLIAEVRRLRAVVSLGSECPVCLRRIDAVHDEFERGRRTYHHAEERTSCTIERNDFR
jgi:hypothetical protein